MKGLIIRGASTRTVYMMFPHTVSGWAGQDRTSLLTLEEGACFIDAAARHLSQVHPDYDPIEIRHLFTRERLIESIIELQNVTSTKGTSHPGESPCLRTKGDRSRLYNPQYGQEQSEGNGTGDINKHEHTVVDWIDPALPGMPVTDCVRCEFGVQVGTRSNLDPASLTAPTVGRIIVTGIREHFPEFRIRKFLSYESITVDLLRQLRGIGRDPEYSNGQFCRRLGIQSADGATCIVFRINSSATLVYFPRRDDRLEAAHLIYHKGRAAPFEVLGLGRVHGHTAFLAAHIAVHVCGTRDASSRLREVVLFGARMSLVRQAALFSRGLFALFFRESQDPFFKYEVIRTPDWSERARWFADIEAECQWPIVPGARNDGVKSGMLDQELDKRVKEVSVDIFEAVCHRTQWFIANSILRQTASEHISIPEGSEDKGPGAQQFLQTALSWLVDGRDPRDDIPIVEIEKLKLIDRREIEDYLAIYRALTQYGRGTQTKPLSIAVFGPPGSGKSFGVSEIGKHLANTSSVFSGRTLSYNMSQFHNLDNLIAALHCIQNECLGGRVPIVFFDEFDSMKDGKPFGWLKYFLSVMEDGQFFDQGLTYQLGRCVLVFAGGVNRSFSEINGRLRNLSFCEAKGHDFISRLRGHLNIYGINKPVDVIDYGRYILRRAIILYHKLQGNEESRRTKGGSLSADVARAFCRIEQFKHGVRSMSAILDMCDVRTDRPLGPSDLPAKAQLEMHVDAGRFLEYLNEGEP